MDELISIAFSHYCEKARWGLERAGRPFRETKALPMLHMLPARRALRGSQVGKADRHSSRYSTPILVTASGPISGSTEILRHADASLFRADDDAWIARFDDALGPHTRRIAYFMIFSTPGALAEIAERNVPGWQTTSLRIIEPLAVRFLTRRVGITREGFERSRAKVNAVMDEVAAALADGRRYLGGDRFGAADLTFAALAAPAVIPEAYGAWLPPPSRFGAEAEAMIEEQRRHPAGRFALRLYEEHRLPAAARDDLLADAPVG